ncbi:bola protein [Cubamyces lactineus]|nr:bola protein [Cubamyces lactineus]
MSTVAPHASDSAAGSSGGPVEMSMRAKLTELLKPSLLEITNDSWQHRHHAPMRVNTMQRHRMIYAALSDEFAAGLHALSLKTKTPAEIQQTKQ